MVGDVPSEVTNRTNRTLREPAKGEFRPRTLIGDMSASRLEVPKTGQSAPDLEALCQQSAPISVIDLTTAASQKRTSASWGTSAPLRHLPTGIPLRSRYSHLHQ